MNYMIPLCTAICCRCEREQRADNMSADHLGYCETCADYRQGEIEAEREAELAAELAADDAPDTERAPAPSFAWGSR